MGDEMGLNVPFRQVEDWLRSLGLICYAQSFYDNGYENLEICRQITEQDLSVIGVSNVKDKNDILAGVCRLKQKAVYFELEPEDEQSQEVIFRKFDPFLLITRVKAEIEKDNVQLTEPPYFYPDGSLGSLDSLAEKLSFTLETFAEDVQNALDQLRRRQLPAGLYNDVNELMEMQKQQEVKKGIAGKTIGPPKPKRREEPKEYLNVETPFRRTTSLSKHDKRITKSTTNLADVEFDEKPLSLDGKKSKKSKQVIKSFSTREKSRHLFGLSIRKRSTTGDNKVQKDRESFVAKDLTLNQQQLIDLMTKVKHGEMSQDTVIAQANMNYRESRIGDMHPLKGLDRHQLTKKDKKRMEKEEKKRRKTERGKPSGHSLFYTSEISDSNQNMKSPVDHDESQDDVISLGHSSGSDISRESPDLRSFGDNRIPKLDNGHAGFVNENSPNSSTGSLNVDQGNIDARGSGLKSRSNSMKSAAKPNKNPPPIPSRLDHKLGDTNQDSKMQNTSSNLLSSFSNKRSLKSTLSAPHPSTPPMEGARLSSEHTKRHDTPEKHSIEQELAKKRSSLEASKEELDDKVFQVKSFPFAVRDLEEIKLKSHEIMRWSVIAPGEGPLGSENKPKTEAPSKVPPKPPERSDIPNDKRQISSKTERKTSNERKAEETKSNEKLKSDEETQKKLPIPPPRRVGRNNTTEEDSIKSKTNEQRPTIPPRKRRSASYETAGDEGVVNTLPVSGKINDSQTIVNANKPVTKPKPALPPRQIPELAVAESGDGSASIKSASQPRESELNRKEKSTRPLSGAKESGVFAVKQKSYRPRSLEELIRLKLARENINIADYPYTNQDGGWFVPFPLVARYSAELERPLEPVIKCMDAVRCELLEQKGKPSKRAVLKEVLHTSDLDPVASSLEGWLVSVGLPMFTKDFKECGLLSFEELYDMTREDVLSMGIFEERHIEKLIKLLKEGK